MSELLFAAAAGLPMAAGWSLHALRLRRRIETARRDPLTGLFTRDAFAERALKVLAGGPSAIYITDLNRFKEINDTYGHAAGDAVIAATGRRLAEWADVNGGIVVRLGGDEFAAVARVFSLADLSWTLGELTRAIEQPVTVDGRPRSRWAPPSARWPTTRVPTTWTCRRCCGWRMSRCTRPSARVPTGLPPWT
ncbi:GGDEF domain-containing protein [Streptomyces canus]|uniref:GGDEF domain-containing protein n=1 Tax=Streptomyces canus TaxID=58343 RepID=UPI00278A909B|nr:GGDEF domain-containing protein [Streptomyces canus]MDQ1068796.1 GGDEF domain-containing protein [Streptomyces canus]